jgi:hypothetical protein
MHLESGKELFTAEKKEHAEKMESSEDRLLIFLCVLFLLCAENS